MDLSVVKDLFESLGLVIDLGIAVVSIVLIHKLKPILKKNEQYLVLHLLPILIPFFSVFILSEKVTFEITLGNTRVWMQESLFSIVAVYIIYELFWKKFIEKKDLKL